MNPEPEAPAETLLGQLPMSTDQVDLLLSAARVIGWVALALVLAWLFRRFVLGRIEAMAQRTDSDVDDRLVYFVRRFYGGIILFIVILVTFEALGIEITPLLAGAGIAGIAVAYAAKDILGNFLSGVFLLVDQPIKIGDRIMIERIGSQWGSWGDVMDVGLRTTTVKNTDGIYVTYPNARLADSIIKNFTSEETPTRFRVRVLVDPSSDLEACLERLVRLARAEPAVLDEPEPSAVVRALYDEDGGHMHAGALLELRCWVADIRVRTRLRSRLLLDITRAFRADGVQLARLQLGGRLSAQAAEPSSSSGPME